MDPLKQILYYQAGGRKIALRPDREFLGVDLSRLDEGQLASLESVATGHLQKINDTFSIIPRKELEKSLIAKFLETGAIFPVFSEGNTQIIVEPEVRVEPSADAPDDMKGLDRWLGQNKDTVQIVTSKNDRYVLAPLSGYGPDAVTLANDIATEFGSLSASPRFIRVVPGPMVSQKSGIPRSLGSAIGH